VQLGLVEIGRLLVIQSLKPGNADEVWGKRKGRKEKAKKGRKQRGGPSPGKGYSDCKSNERQRESGWPQ
jgi:hypothetical protein